VINRNVAVFGALSGQRNDLFDEITDFEIFDA
jgi:hypothetical protein